MEENEQGQELASSVKLSAQTGQWLGLSAELDVNIGTRAVEMHISGTRNNGQDNDSYFDDLSLELLYFEANP